MCQGDCYPESELGNHAWYCPAYADAVRVQDSPYPSRPFAVIPLAEAQATTHPVIQTDRCHRPSFQEGRQRSRHA